MNYKLRPVIDIFDLQEAVNIQYGENFDLLRALFPETGNDCYQSFWYGDDPAVYHGYPWENEENIRIHNCVCTYLQDALPEFKEDGILINISW